MRRYCSRTWFTRSVCPSDCGWYAVERFPLILHRSRRWDAKWEVNWGPRSDTRSEGSPCSLKTCRRYSSAVSSAVTLVVVGQKCAIFVRRSTHTRIALKSWERGSSTMKSRDTELQGDGGIGRGCKGPCGF